MKKIIIFIISIILLISVLDYKYFNNEVYNFINDNYFDKNYKIVMNENTLIPNEYVYKNYSSYVNNTNNFFPKNKQELLNVYYTVLNNGYNDFVFYCSNEYDNCLEEIENLSNDADTFTYINSLIHPFNSFKIIKSNYDNDKKIDIEIEKKYSEEDINKINEKLNAVINELNINNYQSVVDKIKVFHDYLANINIYDQEKENGTSKYNSDTAIGALFEGYAVCSGYTDAMAIFLDKLNLENIKIINEEHAWNAVKIDNKWYHLDLTWDDPITLNNKNIIKYDYFLITNDELLSKNDDKHNFSTDVYNFIK